MDDDSTAHHSELNSKPRRSRRWVVASSLLLVLAFVGCSALIKRFAAGGGLFDPEILAADGPVASNLQPLADITAEASMPPPRMRTGDQRCWRVVPWTIPGHFGYDFIAYTVAREQIEAEDNAWKQAPDFKIRTGRIDSADAWDALAPEARNAAPPWWPHLNSHRLVCFRDQQSFHQRVWRQENSFYVYTEWGD